MDNTFFVSLDPHQTADIVHNAVVKGSLTGEMIDRYMVRPPSGGVCVVMIFEKHYYRAGNRLTLTVVIDDFEGKTRVHSVGGGGGEGFFRFDWGASKSFAMVAENALQQYMVR